MKTSHSRYMLVVALLLTTSCDTPTEPYKRPYEVVKPDDVRTVIRIRMLPSQEAASRLHLSGLELLVDGVVHSVEGDSFVVKRGSVDQLTNLRLRTKIGVEPFFCEAQTAKPVQLPSGEVLWDVFPRHFVVKNGQFAGQTSSQTSCERVKKNCETLPEQDGPFYPASFCEESPVVSMPIVYRFPISLHFDSGEFPAEIYEESWRRLVEVAKNFSDSELFVRKPEGVRVYLDSQFGCSATLEVVVSGEVKAGKMRCALATYANSRQYSPTYWLERSIGHEGVHLLGLGHKCGESTLMTAPGCATLRSNTTLLDAIDVGMWVEGQVLAKAKQPSTFGLKEVLVSARSN